MPKSKPDAVVEKVDFTPPDLLFRFPDDSERKPIKMTYGLEMDIRRMLPDPQTATELLMGDPVTQDYILRRCLTDKNKMITDFADLVKEDQFEDLSYEVREAILMWAGSHALYFFAKRTMGLARLGMDLQTMLPHLLPHPLPNGSESSASETPSPGSMELPNPS